MIALLGRWIDFAEAAPRVGLAAVRRGLLPAGFSTLSVLRREGPRELHWKVMGDALVRFLQGCGPLFTKLGQVLATRDDLLPAALCRRLEALYSAQPPMRRSRVRRSLRRAYPRESPFSEFDLDPIAVGSVGQVHRARLEDGTAVVVKLLRPGIKRAVRRDVNAARVLLSVLFRSVLRTRESTRVYVEQALEDLGRAFETELNLLNEANALEEFRRRFKRNPRVYVPICFPEWSSREILVLEELSGKPLVDLRGHNRSTSKKARKAAELALREILTQIFDEGRFHADPHGGNLLLLDDGRLGLIDLGLTGELSESDRRSISRAVKAILARDANAAYRALLAFGSPPPDLDFEALKKDLGQVFQQHRSKAASRLTGETGTHKADSYRLEELVHDLFKVAHRHRIYLPPSTTLLIKALVTIEGVARSLDPKINIVVTALPILLKSMSPSWLRWSYWTRRARATRSH